MVLAWAARPATAAPDPASQKLRVWGYFQLRLTAPDSAADTLAVRRAKLMVVGKPQPGLDYYLQLITKDGNKSGTDGRTYLQEGWVRFGVGPGRIQVGQFKPPFGMERFTSDTTLYVIDRSRATDSLIPNGNLGESFVRDYGVQWDSTALAKRLWYGVGVFAGSGANNGIHDNGPLVAGRAVWTVREGKLADGSPSRVKIGGAASTRSSNDLNFTSALPGTRPLGYDHFAGRDTRWNLELAADYGPYRWRSEVFRARFASDKAAVPSLSATGFYLLGAYQPGPEWSLAVKHEGLDPNTGVSDRSDLRWTTLGVNYHLRGDEHKVQANYIVKHERANPVDNNAWVVQYQRVF